MLFNALFTNDSRNDDDNLKFNGFDIKEDRVEMMKNKIDPSEELESSAFDGCNILFTHKQEDLKQAINRHHIEVMKGNYKDGNELLGHVVSYACNSMMLWEQLNKS